jgi:two-component system osmolarity sensor histidine kinase EnvZ
MSDNEAFGEDLDELEAIVDSFIGFVRDGRDERAESVDLAEWLVDVAEPYRDLDLHLAFDTCRARIRPLALKRALVNLIDNAYAHGRPPVSLACRVDDDVVVIEVADRGPGLPDDRLEPALRPFERFDSARGSRHNGLGLATVQRIVAGHGGTVALSNRAGGGLRAVIRLPAAH